MFRSFPVKECLKTSLSPHVHYKENNLILAGLSFTSYLLERPNIQWREALTSPAHYCSVNSKDQEHIGEWASFSRAANSELFASTDFVHKDGYQGNDDMNHQTS